jgi:hypothetical protein
MKGLVRGKQQSFVISARLSEASDTERRALEVLTAWEGRGHSRRYVITAALLALDGQRVPAPAPAQVTGGIDANAILDVLAQPLGEMQRVMERISQAAAQMADGDRGSASQEMRQLSQEASGISRRFRESMHAAVKFDEDEE